MKIDSDPYLILSPGGHVRDASPELLRHLETVHRASEWTALGFKIKIDKYGIPSSKSKKYSFLVVFPDKDDAIREAISSGKKALRHPTPVFDYYQAGVSLEDFISLPEDVRFYCQGSLLRLQGKLSEALPLLERACTLNGKEVRYREAYYPVRLELGDLKSIDDEFEYFSRDVDCMVHTGRVDQWIKSLIAAGSFDRARSILHQVDAALQALESGTITAQYYGKQSQDWYKYKRERFAKEAEKHSARIDKAERRVPPQLGV